MSGYACIHSQVIIIYFEENIMSNQSEIRYPFWAMITFDIEKKNEDSRDEIYKGLEDAGWSKSNESNTTFIKEFSKPKPKDFRSSLIDKYSDEESIVLEELNKIVKTKIKKGSGMLSISKNEPVRFP